MTGDMSRYDADPDALALAHAKARELEAVSAGAAFGKRARALRDERGWSLSEMAAHSGLGRATLYRVERGDNIRLSTVAKVAGAFGTDAAQMLAPDGEVTG